MSDDRLSLTLRVDGGSELDASELDEVTRRLRQRLLELDLGSGGGLRGGAGPAGARSLGAVTVGGLVATLGRPPGLLMGAVGILQSWLAGQNARAVELHIGGDTLKISGLSSEEQRR